MKVIYIKTEYDKKHNYRFKTNIKMTQIVDTLDTYYSLLECTSIDIIVRTIANKKVAIIVDGERHLKRENKDKFPIAICTNANEQLFGNIIIAGIDTTEDLSDVPITIQDISMDLYSIDKFKGIPLYEYQI
nr:unnamed protein product [uncultured bacterium]